MKVRISMEKIEDAGRDGPKAVLDLLKQEGIDPLRNWHSQVDEEKREFIVEQDDVAP